MLLALDIGNSRIKWGLYSALKCTAIGRLETREFLGADPAAYEFEPATPLSAASGTAAAKAVAPRPGPLQAEWLAGVHGLAVCSVAGSAVEFGLLQHLHRLGLPELPVYRVQAQARALGVVNGYADPTRLGADRWAALVAARALGTAPTVVVMAGTATTVDALDGDGHFLGGYILPGLRLMPKSLYERTAGIRPGEGAWSEFPTATADAVASGVLAASAGAVAAMVVSLWRHGGARHTVRTLVSGGNGPALLPSMEHMELAPTYERDLVLQGVARLFRASQGGID